jgi:hypothetical protein
VTSRWTTPAVAVGLVASLAGCATTRPEPPRDEQPTWLCRSEVGRGDTVASSSRWLAADGAVRSVQNAWQWRARGPGGAGLLMEQRRDLDAAPAREPGLLISLTFQTRRHPRTSAFELRLGDAPLRLADGGIARDAGDPPYSLEVPVDDLVAAAASGQPVSAVGIGWRGGVALRMPLDVGAIARGREALARAIPAAIAKSRDPGRQCYDVGGDLRIIAARPPLAQAGWAS